MLADNSDKYSLVQVKERRDVDELYSPQPAPSSHKLEALLDEITAQALSENVAKLQRHLSTNNVISFSLSLDAW